MAKRRARDTRYKNKPSTRSMRVRILVVFGFVILGCIGLTYQIVRLNKVKGDNYTKRMLAQQSHSSNAIPYKRGDILDVNGNKLATSVKVYNLFLDPAAICKEKKYIQPTKDALENVFGISGSDVDKILKENPASRYYQMKDFKELDKEYVKKLEKLQDKDENIRGIHFEEEYKREYPYSTIACDVIGFCTDTNTGTWGIENTYNDMLNGTNGRQFGYYDSELNLVKTIKAATNGYTVKSNRESGEGRFDIAVLPMYIDDQAIIIECKHSKNIKELRKDSDEASKQIIDQKYIEGLQEEGYENVIGYGISFYKKQCIITKAG